MRVVIEFNINEYLIKLAIASLLMYKDRITKKAILEKIKDEVYNKGRSCVDFDENWGDDLLDFQSENDEKINKVYDKLYKK
jgi:hypothetical protein